MRSKLTAKQQRFCEEYLVDLNATQAALRAGYCANSVNKTGPANLVKVGIKAEIDRLIAERAEKIELTASWVLQELKANHEKAKSTHHIADSNKALELIGRHLAMFKDKVEHSFPGIAPPEQAEGAVERSKERAEQRKLIESKEIEDV